jgi:hypothetical protein
LEYEYAIRRIQEKQEGLKLNGTISFWLMLMTLIFLGENIDTIQKNTKALLEASKEVGLELNSEETKYMLMSGMKAGQ